MSEHECSGNCENCTCETEGDAVEETQKGYGFLDKVLSKVTSRKLFVFLVGTAFMAMGTVDPGSWLVLAGIYVGGQTIIDAVVAAKTGI